MNYCVNNHLYYHKPAIGKACPLLANVEYNTSYLLKQKQWDNFFMLSIERKKQKFTIIVLFKLKI